MKVTSVVDRIKMKNPCCVFVVNMLAVFFISVLLCQTAAYGADVDDIDPAEILSALPEDAIRSIDHPKFVSGKKADKQMGDDEQVIGLEIDGDAKAYPLYVLSSHEIVNDVIAGRPVAVTW